MEPDTDPKSQIQESLKSLSLYLSGKNPDFNIWRAYARAELAVFLVKLKVGEDLLLKDAPKTEKYQDEDPKRYLDSAMRKLEDGKDNEALTELRIARDILLGMLKRSKKAGGYARKV